MTIAQMWHRAFLERRPSLSLGLFRLAVAWTVACHMLPGFVQMDDNYLPTAFKEKNFSFFPMFLLRLVEVSPDWVVWAFVGLFCASLAAFAAGYYTQRSTVLMTLACYYFYALNSFHIGTLSFDILLVTLVLLCLTNFHGDFFSLDSVGRRKDNSYKRLRPVFIQRLLQLQLALTFFYTGLNKITAGGNWLTGNPYHALMNYPAIGVVKDFPGRGWLAQQPELCYGLGLACVAFELLLPVLLFVPRLRPSAIALGIAFMVHLWLTLHVPTIFLFLFPPLLLLFIRPERLVAWIEARQALQAQRGRAMLLYDGQCGFCLESLRRLEVLDLFRWVDPLDFHKQPDVAHLHPLLTPERCRSEMVLLEPNGRISGGFDAFRRMSPHCPMLWPVVPLLYVPGVPQIGRRVYAWVAAHRYLLHRGRRCSTNQCSLPSVGNGKG